MPPRKRAAAKSSSSRVTRAKRPRVSERPESEVASPTTRPTTADNHGMVFINDINRCRSGCAIRPVPEQHPSDIDERKGS